MDRRTRPRAQVVAVHRRRSCYPLRGRVVLPNRQESAMKSVSKLSLVVLLACACDRTSVHPSETPELASDEALLVIVMNTERPVLGVHYVSAESGTQFNLTSVEAGTSIQVHRVPAGSYCVRTITWQAASFSADHFGGGEILCIEVEPGALNYPGHMQFAKRKPNWSRSRFGARYIQRTDAYEDLLRAEYPELVSWLEP